MADESYNVSVETKAQLEEIQKLLAELRAVNAEISKINGQTFSAVSMSAAELSTTGKDLAKALVSQRIASEELNKMLGKTGSNIENAKNKTKDYKQEVDGAVSSTEGFYMELGAMGARLSTHLPSAIAKTIQAFGEEEVAIQKLSAAIHSNGGNVSEVLPIMQQFASDMQRITGFADDQILSMQGVATSMGVSSDKMDTVMKSAIGLSTALGMDVATATKAASAAIQGKTELLTRYIPTLSMCKTAEEKLAKVQELSANGFSQAEASANTLLGRLKAASNAWGDLQEVIGETFVPTVKTVAGLLQGVCEIFTQMPILTKTMTTALTSLAVGFAFTKVGGLMNVAKMILGVGSSIKGATTAMQAFNMAIKANPIGLIASGATAAILGLGQLYEYLSLIETEEEKEAAAQDAARIARKKAAEETKAATAVLDEYAESIKNESESADDAAGRIDALKSEIESLANRSKWKEGELVETAEKLVGKKDELVKLQKHYLELVNATASAEYQFMSNRETERKYRVEQELNAARKTGIAHIIAFKEAELKHVEELQKSAEIQKKYYADHAHLVNSEEDRKRIMADAVKYADESIEKMREEKKLADSKASTEKWLAAELEASKSKQRALDMDILKARAAGNESLAKEREGKLRIAQLSAEIFENTRKEGMSRKELETLQQSATQQAQDRYKLEKSVTDEVERQNLAKDAQAKIEDILMANKIEQLKAEGKLTEAKELEREREIKRTLAGMKGVSKEDKEKLAATMRQTNDYKDKQETARNSKSGGKAGGSGGGRVGGGNVSRGTVGSSSSGDGTMSMGGQSRKTGRPATVSAKYADLYDQWKAAGGSKSGQNWQQFRKSNADPESKKKLQAKSLGIIGKTEEQAREMSGLKTPPLGDALAKSAASSADGQSRSKPSPTDKTGNKKLAAGASLNNKLEAMGTESKPESSADASAQSLSEIAAGVKAMGEDIKSLKSSVTALAERKDK